MKLSKKSPPWLDQDLLAQELAKKGCSLSEPEFSKVIDSLESVLAEAVRNEKNRRRVRRNDAEKHSWPAAEVLSEEQLSKLPEWVLSQLDDSVVVGTSRKVVQVPDGRKFHLGNALNELSGAEWTFFLNSVLSTRYATAGPDSFAHHIRKIHPSPKPPQLMRGIIEFFTKSDELVLDYFMGVGGTLLGASLANRRAVGIDLSSKYIDAYKAAANELKLAEQQTIVGDAMVVLQQPSAHSRLLVPESVSLIAIDPPYGDMMKREKTGETAKLGGDVSPTPFTDLAADLGNLPIEEFHVRFRESVQLAMPLLRNNGHLVVFTKDLQPQGSTPNLLHARIIEELSLIEGLRYLGLKVWADLGVNLYPYGYPHAFVANQIHQYIMFFKKVS
jgi:hypothetical protein